MMNQTKKHTTGKKLLALLLALIMTVSLLPMSVFAAEPGTEETPVVEGQTQPAAETGADDADQAQEPDADEANEDEAPVDEGEDTALPGDAEGDADDADAADDGIATFAATDATVQYKILHLDCGRKYFSKEWIIALLNEMSAAGYNQLQLAFGNKGLRFLLEDMSVTVNGKTYDNKKVTKAIQAGNKAYYDAREKNELTQTEMDAILAKAKELKIDIVPLFNTPFHMEAVITAMQQLDMTDVYYSEKGCLNLNNDAAKKFVTALMQKYVNYFAKKNCNFFNFGADEYKGGWNTTFYNYADSIAKMISTAGMTARVFNDSFRGDSWNNGALVTTNGSIGKDYLDGVCYWYTGYKSYTDDTLYASASALNTEGYGLINTNKVYYYVVSAEKMYEWGSKTAVQYVFSGTYNEAEWIDHAKGFSNTTYNNWAGTNNGTGPAPIGSMFCVWSDNPGDKTETQIAQEIRMILRVMAARMDNKTTYSSSDVIVTGGFNADGTINGSSSGGGTSGGGTESSKTVEVKLSVGQTSEGYEGAAGATITKLGDTSIATAKVQPVNVPGKTTRKLGDILTTYDAGSYEGVIAYKEGTDKYHYMKLSVVNGKADITDTTKIDEATVFTFNRTYSGCTIQAKDSSYYVAMQSNYSYGYTYTLTAQIGSYTWSVGSGNDFYYSKYYISYSNNDWELVGNWESAGKGYSFTETTTTDKKATNITFTGVKPGETTYVIGGVTYHITVEAKTVNVTLEAGDKTTFNVGSSKISKSPDPTIATAEWKDGVLTLTGVAASDKTTECIVGDTKYVIKVVAKGSTTGDSPLYVDLWVTNHGVKPDASADYTIVNGGKPTDTGARRVTLQYEATKFASSKGLSVSEFLPSTGSDTADSTRVAAYWKTRYLPQSTRQTTAGWTNKSGYGTDVLSGKAGGLDIERVRYYGGTWAYLPVGGTDWVDFTTAESDTNKAAVTKDDSGAQIAAFYMLKTKVTKEVTTYVTDWPDEVSNDQNKWIFGVALDYCVKFEGDTSTRYPATFGKTATTQSQWFNCQYATSETTAKDNGYTLFATEVSGSSWKGSGSSQYYRVINNIQAVETAQYEVYMITTLATAGDLSTVTDVDKQNYDMPASIDYPDEYSKEKVIWAIDEKTATDSGLEKHDEYKQGGTPDVSRVVIQRGTGMLLTYYVRAKATTASKVTVEYYENRSNVKFYSFDIPTGTKIPNTFESFNWDEKEFNQTPYVDPWIGKHDICNSDGRSITINSDLALVSGLAAKYKAGGFTLTNIVRSEDSRTLKLYYDFTNSFTYVVDFGVPAKIERQSTQTVLKVTCGDKVLYDAENLTAKDAVEGENGKLYMTDVTSLYYELTTMRYSGEPDTFTLMFTYQNSDNTTTSEKAFNVTVIPASNVYYEDTKSFMTFENGQGVAENAKWTEEFDADKNAAIDSKQIAEIVGEANNNVYGYDLTYDNCTMFSLGRAHKVTVSADMVNNWSDQTDAWPTAEFTFKGTGFDVISLTDNKSGLLICDVVDADGNDVYNHFVNNYYGYGYVEGEGWKVVDKDDPNALYQLPVVKVDGLDYGTYKVTLTVAYGKLFDKTGNSKYSFWLDGVRIYDPAGPDLNNTYANDGEGWPKYIELHDELVKNDKNATTLFIEGDAQADIKAYTSYGPNHEVYLLNEQILAFKLANTAKVDKIHIGAKAPMGHATLKVNGQVIEPAIRTATDMYYDITKLVKDDGTVIITNADTAGDSILSLTQLKVTYTAEPTETGLASLAILTETEKQQVVQMVRAMYAPVEPEVFTPERFEASWNRSTVKVGQRATLTVKTSTDVDVITVDGVTVTNYRTRTQRTGWGWNATKVTYREFTYTITATEAGTLDYSVVAVNADGVSSEPISAMLTVQAVQRPQRPSWLDKIFSRWF